MRTILLYLALVAGFFSLVAGTMAVKIFKNMMDEEE